MTMKTSTGLRNKLLVTGSFKSVMDLGKIQLYSGTEPATADASAAATATLVCTITNNSTATGVTWDTTATAGVLNKNPAETWSGVNSTSLTVNFFRIVAAGDTDAVSTTQARVQGSIALAGSDMNLATIALVGGVTTPLDAFAINIPTL